MEIITDGFILSESRNNLPKKIFNTDNLYNWPELVNLKKELNKEKSQLDKYNINEEASKKLYLITAPMREYDLLRGEKGLLVNDFGAEIVTNAWLKMYEILNQIHPYFQKIAKSRNNNLITLHLAEAPGNFLLAFNHFLKTNYPSIYWQWFANSYIDLYSKKSTYLADNYGLMKKFKKQWLYGADCDGDITSPANIRTFVQNTGKVHIVTSDVKYVPENPNFNEEENYNIPVHLGHIIISLSCLKKGGIAILKHLTLLESASISLLYLLSCCFESVKIFKPLTSKAANSEVYLICTGFYSAPDALIEKLLDAMQTIRYMNNEKGSPALFQQMDLPLSFINQILIINEKLTTIQINNIKKMIICAEQNKNKTNKQIYQECINLRKEYADLWIKKMNIKNLEIKDKLLK